MIVNPQLFNYRLIIGTLVIAIVVLGSYSISSHNTFKNHEAFLEQENKLVQNELSEMISLYDGVSIENETINLQLEQAKYRVVRILDSVKLVKADLSLISKYKKQIASLNKEKVLIFKTIDSVLNDNKLLKEEAYKHAQEFELQKAELTSLKTQNANLTKIIREAGALSAESIEVTALKTMSALNVFETDKLKDTDHIEVCSTLLSNQFTPQGNKNIYVQIIDPNNNVVADRGLVTFADESSLIYSAKTVVNNIGGKLDVCTKINIDDKSKLKPGDYYVSVFHEDTLLGHKAIRLN